MDNTQRFTGLAAHYRAGRPTYPASLLTYLSHHKVLHQTDTIADIGAGTGIWSALLASRGHTVYAVEPNDDMRRIARETVRPYPSCHLIKGTAEDTTLAAASIDVVTAAQAFHWFDPAAFRRECLRIGKASVRAILVWNIRDQSAPVHQDSYAIYTAYCPKFKGFHNGLMHDDSRIQTFFGATYDYVTFDNPITYDEETFIQRHLSNSYSLQPTDAGYAAFVTALRALFQRYAQDGVVIMPCHTVAYIGTLR